MLVAEQQEQEAKPAVSFTDTIFSEKTKAKVKKAIAIKQFQQTELMPDWSDEVRGMPNEIVRSALFNARNRNKKREHLKSAEICVIGDGTMRYTGEELRQHDEVVWLELLHLARGQAADQVIEFTPYSFCKAISWSINSKSYDRLRECLHRMQATSLSIYCKRLSEGVSMSMIPIFHWRDENGKPLARYKVMIAPQLVELFGVNYFTKIEWQQRLSLSPGLATWLHRFYASHSAPFANKIETLMAGSGSTNVSAKSFKICLKTALDDLVEIGFLKSYNIDEKGLVKVERNNRPTLQ